MRPNIDITLLNGQLGLTAPSEFGTAALLIACAAAPTAGYGVPFLVTSKQDVISAFANVLNAPVVTAINTHFYSEAPEGTKLYILAMANTTSLTTLFAAANADKVLILGNGSIRLVGAIKFPDVSYVPTVTAGIDADCTAAVTAAQTLADDWFGRYQPFRCLVQAFAVTTTGELATYEAGNKRNVGMPIFSINNSYAYSLCQVLGRAAKVGSSVNIGRVKSGSLNIADNAVIKIGATTIDQVSVATLEQVFTKRYIGVERNAIASGVVITDDVMLTAPTDDYNTLVNGRVIDNVVRIAFRTYYAELKDNVDVNANGRLNAITEKALENSIKSAVDLAMRDQLSKDAQGTAAVSCLVNPDPTAYSPLYIANGITNPNLNLIQTNGRLYIFVTARPQGYLKDINIYLGLSAS